MSKEDPTLTYINEEKIGEGSTASIYVAVNKFTNQKVAIKKMKITNKNIEQIQNEILIMHNTKNPHVVGYINSYLVDSSNLWVYFYLLFILLVSKELPKILKNWQRLHSRFINKDNNHIFYSLNNK